MRKIVFVAVQIYVFQIGIAQSKPLKVGDTIPNIEFSLLNWPSGRATINDFKGKVLILDFWFPGCMVCLQQFPLLTELQNRFKNNLAILPVGFDSFSDGSIEQFVSRRKGTKRELKLPTAVIKRSDSLLLKLFPTSEFPHEIWIDKDGRLLGITGAEAITEKNIALVINGEDPKFDSYKLKKNLEANTPFLIPREAAGYNTIFGSVITGYIDTIGQVTSRFGYQDDPGITRLFLANQTVYNLYRLAYKHENWQKRMFIDTIIRRYADQPGKKADNRQLEKYNQKNLFSYELIHPATVSVDSAYSIMIKDLDRFFNIHSKIEKRQLTCLALVRTSRTDRLRSKSNELALSYSEDQLDVSFQYASMKADLVNYLNGLVEDYLVIDETNYKNKIDIEFHLNSDYDLNDIRNLLGKYDLDLIKVNRSMEILVLEANRKL